MAGTWDTSNSWEIDANETSRWRPRVLYIIYQEDREQDEHADDGDAANDRQPAALEIAPVAPGGLNEAGSPRIRNGDPAGDLVAPLQRIQKLVFLDGFGRRPEGKLCGGRICKREQQYDGSA